MNKSILQQQPIDFGQLFRPVLKYWYIFLFSIGACIAMALFYLNHAAPIYEVKTTLLLRDSEKNGLTRDALQKELLGMAAEPKIYEDARILKSHTLMQEVIDSLNLEHRLLRKDGFKIVDLYHSTPIDMAKSSLPQFPKEYNLKILNSTQYRLQVEETNVLEGFFGKPLRSDDGTLLLYLNEDSLADLDTSANYILQTNSILGSAQSYAQAFGVEYDKNQPTLLDLYVHDEVPERGLKILEEVVNAYNRIMITNKGEKRKNALAFIDERIELLTDELQQVELELERYKNKENLTIDYQSDLPYIQGRIGYFERELVSVEVEQGIMKHVANTLETTKNQFFPIVDFGVEHQALSNLITQYNNLIQEQKRLGQTVTEDYPTVQLLNSKIESFKISIEEEVAKKQQQLAASVLELNAKKQKYLTQLGATPRRERELVAQKRQQLIKENLYKFLLEKREEAALSVAAVSSNASVVDPPFLGGQVAPKRSSVLLGASLLGFFLPFATLLLFSLFDSRLRRQDEWAEYTEVPVLGGIVRSRSRNKLAIQHDNHSPTAESFRSLRTNLDFFLSDFSNRVILVTSSSIQEGKSFTTINLGMSYALSEQKVLLIDCDLRNPKMTTYLGLPKSELGISDYLTKEADLSDIVQVYDKNPNLHYISSGSEIPPNPSELLMSKRMLELLTPLKEEYDMIILDSPAAGLVGDSLLLSRFANASLYIARVGVTEREDLKIVEQLHRDGKLTKPAIVFNGIKKGRIYKRAEKKGYYYKKEKSLLSFF